jgi:Zn finger protein HypA/HybF involved in hydrogenase expression
MCVKVMQGQARLRLEMTLEAQAAPLVVEGAPLRTQAERLVPLRCPLCRALLVHVDVVEECPKCGMVMDL